MAHQAKTRLLQQKTRSPHLQFRGPANSRRSRAMPGGMIELLMRDCTIGSQNGLAGGA